MEFGIFSNGSRPNRPQAQAWAEDLYEIVLGDKLGFQEAWVSEHAVAGEFLICKAAALTKQIKLGPGVRSLPLYHPAQVASEANTVDHLTNGRYLLGCGVGFFPTRMNERGIDPALGHDMARESLDFITRCWTEPEPFDFNGRFWNGKAIKVRPEPYQRPHPPIAMACSDTRESAELAGERGYWILFGSTADPVYQRLVDYYNIVGGFGTLMFHMGRDYGSRRGRARSMRLFMEQVAPRLRTLNPD